MLAIVGWLLGAACAPSPAPVAHADDAPTPIPQDYLGDWDCAWRYASQVKGYPLLDAEVRHHWSFQASTYDTDYLDLMVAYGTMSADFDGLDRFQAVVDQPWFKNNAQLAPWAEVVPSETRQLRPVAHDTAQILVEYTDTHVDIDNLIHFSMSADNPDAMAIFYNADQRGAILCQRASE